MNQSASKAAAAEVAALQAARDEFIAQWGVMGSAWGVNRTMAQIHALLMVATNPLTTDEIMEELKVSRGNANMNLRELCGWGLIRSVIRKGERKEYFEAEKDVWKMFCIVVRERKRREIRPAINVLKDCVERADGLKSAEAVAFVKQIKSLSQFMETADGVFSKVVRLESSSVVPWALKFLK